MLFPACILSLATVIFIFWATTTQTLQLLERFELVSIFLCVWPTIWIATYGIYLYLLKQQDSGNIRKVEIVCFIGTTFYALIGWSLLLYTSYTYL